MATVESNMKERQGQTSIDFRSLGLDYIGMPAQFSNVSFSGKLRVQLETQSLEIPL